MIRKIVFIFALTLGILNSYAVAEKFTMTAPNVVRKGEQFRLSFTLNSQGTELQLPSDLSANFDVLMGPSTQQSSSFRMVNGKTTQSVTFSYIYVLRGKTEGKFTIRPASIKVDGKVIQSNSLNIQVVKGQANTSQQRGGSQQQQTSSTTNISKEDLFAKVVVDKTSVYRGEQIIATIKLFVSPNIPLRGTEEPKLPAYEGFWTQDIDIPQATLQREVYDNKLFQVATLKKTILFPQQTGKLKINPFEITGIVQQRIRSQRSFSMISSTVVTAT